MSNYEDVYAPDLTEETESTLSGAEQFVMFDSVEGKRAELSTIADYIVANGEIDGSDIPTIVSTIEGSIGTLDTKVGDLTDLDTEDKDNLVAAINEAYGKAEDADAHVGDLTDLDTTDKTDIVSAVNEVNGKAEDADAKADTVDEHVGDLSELETEDKTSAVDAINEVLSKIPVMTKEVTGNPIVIDDALNADVVSLGVELEPVQEGSGTPSPTNVRPITGHDSVTVVDTGINQWDEELEVGIISWTGNNAGGDNDKIRSKNYIPCLPNTTYYAKTPKSIQLFYYGADEHFISYEATSKKNATFTTPANARYIRFYVYEAGYGTTYNHDISINYPSTDTAYHAYHGQSKTVTLPHTVYGGKPNITTGNGTETLANIASYNGETINEPWWSSMDEYVQGTTPTTGAQVVYTLATPTDLSTTPTDITLYNGDNVVSSDGDMDMVYVRDIVKVIEKLEG